MTGLGLKLHHGTIGQVNKNMIFAVVCPRGSFSVERRKAKETQGSRFPAPYIMYIYIYIYFVYPKGLGGADDSIPRVFVDDCHRGNSKLRTFHDPEFLGKSLESDFPTEWPQNGSWWSPLRPST